MSRNDKLHDNENAVSPIIGMILLVAITIVLAATIAMFSFNFTNEKEREDGVSVQVVRVNSTHILVTFMGSVDNHNILFDSPSTPNGMYGETDSGFYGSFNVTANGVQLSNVVPKGAPNCTSMVGSGQFFSPVPANAEVSVIANFKANSPSLVWTGIV